MVGQTNPFQMPGLVNPSQQLGSFTSFGSSSLNPTSTFTGGMGMPGSQGFAQQPNVPGGTFSKIGGVLGSQGFANGLGAFSTLASIYTGFKGLGLAKDQLNFQKSSFNKNFNASAKDYENKLKDKWNARNNAAAARGKTFAGMDEWVSGRSIKTGKASKNKVGG